jgi:hypothetical protein
VVTKQLRLLLRTQLLLTPLWLIPLLLIPLLLTQLLLSNQKARIEKKREMTAGPQAWRFYFCIYSPNQQTHKKGTA